MLIRCLTFTICSILLSNLNLSGQVTDNSSQDHVFAEFADGKFSDGTSYKSTLMVSSDDVDMSCVWSFFGMTVPGIGDGTKLTFTLPAGGWKTVTTPGTQDFQAGYSTLHCTQPVTAQILYTYSSASGQVLSEATVFSSPAATIAQFIADERNGSQLGIAIANTGSVSKEFLILATDSDDNVVGTGSLTIGAVSQIAEFLDEIIPGIPANYLGAVFIVSNSNDFDDVYGIGLKFTGNAFTTIPVTLRTF